MNLLRKWWTYSIDFPFVPLMTKVAPTASKLRNTSDWNSVNKKNTQNFTQNCQYLQLNVFCNDGLTTSAKLYQFIKQTFSGKHIYVPALPWWACFNIRFPAMVPVYRTAVWATFLKWMTMSLPYVKLPGSSLHISSISSITLCWNVKSRG